MNLFFYRLSATALGEVGRDGHGCPTDLISESETLLCRETALDAVDIGHKGSRFGIYLKVLKGERFRFHHSITYNL